MKMLNVEFFRRFYSIVLLNEDNIRRHCKYLRIIFHRAGETYLKRSLLKSALIIFSLHKR